MQNLFQVNIWIIDLFKLLTGWRWLIEYKQKIHLIWTETLKCTIQFQYLKNSMDIGYADHLLKYCLIIAGCSPVRSPCRRTCEPTPARNRTTATTQAAPGQLHQTKHYTVIQCTVLCFQKVLHTCIVSTLWQLPPETFGTKFFILEILYIDCNLSLKMFL